MERWRFIGWGIAASVLAHFLLAGAIFLSSDVRTYDQAAPDPIPVDIVLAEEEPVKPPEPTPTPTPSPSPELNLPSLTPTQSAPSQQQQAAAQPAAQPQPQPQPQPSPSAQPTPRETAKPQAKAAPQSQPQPSPQSQTQPQPQSEPRQPPSQSQQSQQTTPSASPPPQGGQSYTPAQPDLTVRYGVMLGLPDALPPLAMSADKPTDDKEAGVTATSNLATDLVTGFRQHLRSCSKLPGSISSADNVRVKLRVIMTPDGRLATEPDVIEVTNPMKAIELKQAAVSALTACQPYTMLPADRYREWRVLELSFAPQDFAN
jgi:outer membrane biosynthesis protein TonB